MYESFFNLHSRPFTAAPVVALYFPAGSIECAYHTLVRCIDRAEGPALVIGGAGAGKTMLCQLLAQRFAAEFDVAMLSCAQVATPRALLQLILFELGLPYSGLEEGELRLSLIDYLKPRDESAQNGVLLLVDEAHALPRALLEEVRMLTNVAAGGQPRVRLVLTGGPALEETFADPKMECFNQRVAARCYLHSLTYDETLDFVASQICAVGGNPQEVFTDDALQAVYHASDGIPRLINQVCDHALMLAIVAEQHRVDAALIEEAWADLQQLPPPNPPASTAASLSEDVVEFGTLDEIPAVETPEPFATEEAEPKAESIDLTDQLNRIQLCVASLDDDKADQTTEDQAVDIEDGILDLAPLDELDDERSEQDQEQMSATPIRAANPFDECYEQEELIADRYAALDDQAGPGRIGTDGELSLDRVKEAIFSEASNPPTELPEVIETSAAESVEIAETESIASEEQTETNDILPDPVLQEQKTALSRNDCEESVECIPNDERRQISVMREPPDDSDLIVLVGEEAGVNGPAGNAYRQEYSQLFSRLRQT